MPWRKHETGMRKHPIMRQVLRRKDFDEICEICPGIQAALEQADRDRKKELDNL